MQGVFIKEAVHRLTRINSMLLFKSANKKEFLAFSSSDTDLPKILHKAWTLLHSSFPSCRSSTLFLSEPHDDQDFQ